MYEKHNLKFDVTLLTIKQKFASLLLYEINISSKCLHINFTQAENLSSYDFVKREIYGHGINNYDTFINVMLGKYVVSNGTSYF